MKKIFRLIAALAATTVAFSCMEEANPETPATNGESTYDGHTVTLEFSIDELETKTAWDGENHTWSEGDHIKIIWMDAEGQTGDVPAEVIDGKVTAEVGVADTYYAVYPETTIYALEIPEDGTEAQLSIVIPQTQDGSFKQANIMAAKTAKTDAVFAFKNMTHIFKFTLSEDTDYKGFQFMSNLPSKFMSAGLSLVTFNEDSDDPVTVGEPKTGNIGGTEYAASSIVQVGNLKPGGTYYVGLYPNVDMSYGFGFKATKQVNDSDNKPTGWINGALTTNPVTTLRSGITNIPEIDKAIRKNWFFKEDGKGDGSDWEHAGGAELLVKLLGSELAEGVNYNKNTNGWRLYGATLHLAAGEYLLPETINFLISVNNNTAIYGGYPTNLAGTSLENRDASANETIITKDGGTRLFAGNGSQLYNWTWDGITFTLKEGSTSTDRGGAFYFNASTKGTVKFVNCTFKNLKTTHTNGGGAFDFNTANQTFNASFTNCKFTDNNGKVGGAIAIEDGRNAKITFTKCYFSGNTATSAGGAIANSIGNIIVDECTFSNNKSSQHGGAICAYGDNLLSVNNYADGIANVYVYNSVFDSNDVSSHQGGAIKMHGKCNLVVLNSTFNKNNAQDGIIRLRAGDNSATAVPNVKAWIISCTFSSNNRYSLYNQSSTAYVYNSVLNDENSFIANNVAGSSTFGKSMVFNTSYFNVASGTLKGKDAVSTLTDKKTLDATVVGTYTNGVFPVTGDALTSGMSSDELSVLATDITDAMPLFETKYLTVDQKGNSREGKTIMGAYVGQ